MIYWGIAAKRKKSRPKPHPVVTGFLACAALAAVTTLVLQTGLFRSQIDYGPAGSPDALASTTPPAPQLDRALYDSLMRELAFGPVAASSSPEASSSALVSSAASSTAASSTATSSPALPGPWPAPAPYPEAGAVLPFDRIVAYYGNFLSASMGVLGQYPPEEMLTRLMQEVASWQAADPSVRAVPAIDYIAVTAQGYPGADGKYRARMPASEVEKAITLADRVNGLVILDVQVGRSTLQDEIPLLEPYLKLPNVELAIDPEFSMKGGGVPGRVIGTFDAADIDYAAQYLAQVVKEYSLPPKVLVVHRFTEDMVTGYRSIAPLPEVEIVMDMDGYGTPAQKIKVYDQVVKAEPVQFTGIKLFYKNDVRAGGRMMTPQEVLALRPRPSFIQYQ
ncbi:MAG: hypothetical protein KGI69_03020 [Patescibacteria group bacterium]|nr:hypothetical protein [Patescibacteria group bacterium]